MKNPFHTFRSADAQIISQVEGDAFEALSQAQRKRAFEMYRSKKLSREVLRASISASGAATEAALSTLASLHADYSRGDAESYAAFLDLAGCVVEGLKSAATQSDRPDGERKEALDQLFKALDLLARVEEARQKQRASVVKFAAATVGAVALGTVAILSNITAGDE